MVRDVNPNFPRISYFMAKCKLELGEFDEGADPRNYSHFKKKEKGKEWKKNEKGQATEKKDERGITRKSF